MCPITLIQSNNTEALYKYKGDHYLILYRETGINQKIMSRIFKQLESMQEIYSRVSVTFLQFHLKKWSPENKVMSAFLKSFKKILKREYNCKARYIWVREQNGAPAQHYHMAILLSGHKCDNSYNIHKLADTLWRSQNVFGYAYPVENAHYMVHRNKKDEFKAAIYRLAYLAKNYSKVFDKDINRFGVGRL
ncbi:MAG: inovirus-type Gp2 protein [Aliivibrio sp.]|uniref:YagK/YfjJ domain-containing protein n=1 Tax=Aliivibrio sp. TaxID=1872443 RepID=UPI001A3F8C71|nr:inovirus-type Gp2 protein [Aliivibrio sp.]